MRFWIRQCRLETPGPVTDAPRPISPAMMYLQLAADQQDELVIQQISRPRRIAAVLACIALGLFLPLAFAKTAFAHGTGSRVARSAAKVDLARKHETNGSDHQLGHHKLHRHKPHHEGDHAGGGNSNTGGTAAGGSDSTVAGGGGSNTGGTAAGGSDSTIAGGGGSNTGGTAAGGSESTIAGGGSGNTPPPVNANSGAQGTAPVALPQTSVKATKKTKHKKHKKHKKHSVKAAHRHRLPAFTG